MIPAPPHQTVTCLFLWMKWEASWASSLHVDDSLLCVLELRVCAGNGSLFIERSFGGFIDNTWAHLGERRRVNGAEFPSWVFTV